MTTGLRAIETKYNGYRFRSRLEARWAVFFDVLRIPYSYEAEGVDLDGEWYLPDFKLIRGAMACPCDRETRDAFGWSDEDIYRWVEIKPDGISVGLQAVKNLTLLAQISKRPAYLLRGEPFHDSYAAAMAHSGRGGWEKQLLWSECPVCGTIDLQKDGGLSGTSTEPDGSEAPMFYCAHCDVHGKTSSPSAGYWHKGFWVVTKPDWQPTVGPRLTRAFTAARGARFEHGESGAPH